jgi:beta-mannosidase
MKRILGSNWQILQDVHDSGERLQLFADTIDLTAVGHQLSEWEPIERLQHLQVLLADKPYWGRALRYFNQAPWWYRNEFVFAAPAAGARTMLRFTNVDYFCRVWLNGIFLGSHEGYATPFEFDVTNVLRHDDTNWLMVKVWSPWDSEVRGDALGMRTFQVVRNLVKGTYEHDDTLVARDVNPVGIYGSVTLVTESGPHFVGRPRVTTTLDENRTSGSVTVRGNVHAGDKPQVALTLRLVEEASQAEVARHEITIAAGESADFTTRFDVSGVAPWNVWDQGDQPLYRLEMRLDGSDAQERRIAFRSVGLKRDTAQTVFIVNGKPLFVRGTSYFPDVYISSMTRERYLRDLNAIRAAGFNLVRVHVHVELNDFYELCDELGIGVIQDSEYNWSHPVTDEWAGRLTDIFTQTILMLDDHPSLIAWICLNEPGVFDPGGRTDGYAMQISPGPRLYAAVTALDPARAVIKGSFCFDDPHSGDSHNYAGSLEGAAGHYTDIDGTQEKLNTEFGFDAPGSLTNLCREPQLYARLGGHPDIVTSAQEYQYRLLKYYIEHYRTQRYLPCSGYVQFMFIDLSPQSFYGIYDWWGLPKRSLDAMMESNQPVAVLIEQSAKEARAIWLINDTSRDLGEVTVSWRIADDTGRELAAGRRVVECGPNSGDRLVELAIAATDSAAIHASITACDATGSIVAANRYQDMFGHPPHVKGHPARMSHELGMRLYSS